MTTKIKGAIPEKIASPLAPEPYEEGGPRLEVLHASKDMAFLTLSPQKEKFVHYVVSGMSIRAAAVACGAAGATGDSWMRDSLVQRAIDHFREKNREKLEFTLENAHTMYMETFQLARDKEDPVAMKNVVDSLVKLHGIAKAPQTQDINIKITNDRQAARLPDEQLLKEAGLSLDYLSPAPKRRRLEAEPVTDAEFTEITE